MSIVGKYRKKLFMRSNSTANSTPLSMNAPGLNEDAEVPMSKKSRRIFVNVDPKDAKGRNINQNFSTNKVQTTKYTFFTFLPKNLFEQFRSVANFYFTGLIILQSVDLFKEVDFILTAAPLIVILAITAVKDAVEDYRRHIADQGVNNSKTYVLHQPNIQFDEPEQAKESFASKLFFNISGFINRRILIPLNIIEPPETEENLLIHPPVLLASDYLKHERPKRQSVVMRPSTVSAPANEPFWKLKKWENVKVGDFILLRSNQAIPADIVVLSTSESDGICYVETKNLDGETNLKIRRGVPDLSHLATPQNCFDIKAYIDVEAPNELMYNFNASIRLNPTDPSAPRLSVAGARISVNDRKYSVVMPPGQLIPVTINGVLLRGCVLRNTDWVIGIVVYTGADTKLMRNAGNTPSKRSRIDRQLNPQILLNFLILFAMCIICGVLGAIYQGAFNFSSVPFAPLADTGDTGKPAFVFMVSFFSCMIIFQSIIPIALYLSIDICKTLQSLLINKDDEMYDPESDKHVLPRTWNLCDDLGQIEYIFSDKTGTLTCNVMEFRKCSINGVIYGNTYSDKRAAKGTKEADEQNMRDIMKSFFDTKYVSDDPLSFVDPDIHLHLKRGGDQSVAIKQFFALLAVCHTVLAEKYEDDEYAMMYKAQSPDEKALVEAARDVGFAFLRREGNFIICDILGEEQSFELLHVIEFNSDRKRMSIILQPPQAMNLPEGDVLLFCKGADSIIFDRLGDENNKDLKTLTSTHLEIFANDGLRTLCLAYRVVPKDIYEPWAENYLIAQSLIKDREKEVDLLADQLERDLRLMGATAIEDKLQEGVPKTIALLAKAGIKIWVLTGDKMETAINIGFSCNLLQKNMILIVIKGTSPEDTLNQLNEAISKFWDEYGSPKDDKAVALIIDGDSLTFAFDESGDSGRIRQATLLELACRCKSVICCRVSPLQKAQVVALVRKGLGAMCLSIGDGANDVSMIQEADIGIGISGKEGLQAVMASDYAIAQFRFLGRLLLVHGRWAYVRISEMILLYFYKNVVWLFILFWYQFDSGFTGDIITDFTYGMFFNTFFTVLPNLLVGSYDQDINDVNSVKYPELYGKGIRQELYNMERFWLYIFDGIYQSVIFYYFGSLIFSEGAVDNRGYSCDKNCVGTSMAIYCVIAVNIYLGLNNFSWFWITHFSVYSMIALFIGYVIIHSLPVDSNTYGETPILLVQPQLYFSILLAVVTSLLPRITLKAIQQYFYPNDTDILQEMQKYNIKVPDHEKVSGFDESESMLGSSANAQDLSNSFSKMRLATVPESPAIPETTEKSPETAEKSASIDEIGKRPPPPINVTAKSRSASSIHSAQSISPTSAVSGLAFASQITGIVPLVPDKKRRSTSSVQEIKTTEHRDTAVPVNSASSSGTHPKSRRNSQSVVTTIGDMFLQPLSLMGKNVGDFMKNMPKKLRIGSLSALSKLEKAAKSPSLVFMGTNLEVPNTGFAFSHEDGMEDIITPMRPSVFSERVPAIESISNLELPPPEIYSAGPSNTTAPQQMVDYRLEPEITFTAASPPESAPKPILSRETSTTDTGSRKLSRKTSKVTFNIPNKPAALEEITGSQDLPQSDSEKE